MRLPAGPVPERPASIARNRVVVVATVEIVTHPPCVSPTWSLLPTPRRRAWPLLWTPGRSATTATHAPAYIPDRRRRTPRGDGARVGGAGSGDPDSGGRFRRAQH